MQVYAGIIRACTVPRFNLAETLTTRRGRRVPSLEFHQLKSSMASSWALPLLKILLITDFWGMRMFRKMFKCAFLASSLLETFTARNTGWGCSLNSNEDCT